MKKKKKKKQHEKKCRNFTTEYGTTGTQERVLVRQGTRATRVRAIEVLLYLFQLSMISFVRKGKAYMYMELILPKAYGFVHNLWHTVDPLYNDRIRYQIFWRKRKSLNILNNKGICAYQNGIIKIAAIVMISIIKSVDCNNTWDFEKAAFLLLVGAVHEQYHSVNFFFEFFICKSTVTLGIFIQNIFFYINVDATWLRRIDVNPTSFWHKMPAGITSESHKKKR